MPVKELNPSTSKFPPNLLGLSILMVGNFSKTMYFMYSIIGLPIINLSGHQIGQYFLHSGTNIPNIDDKRNVFLGKGIYAIEPFATSGNGKVYEGKPSGIYELIKSRNIRNSFAREILQFIISEYKTLPFCSRWLVKKFGAKSLFALKQLEESGNLREFPQLIEESRAKVSQAEHTVLVEENEIIVTTK